MFARPSPDTIAMVQYQNVFQWVSRSFLTVNQSWIGPMVSNMAIYAGPIWSTIFHTKPTYSRIAVLNPKFNNALV